LGITSSDIGSMPPSRMSPVSVPYARGARSCRIEQAVSLAVAAPQ
jgi:hypothetical protein